MRLTKGMPINLPLWLVIGVAISEDILQGCFWFTSGVPVCQAHFYGWLIWTGILMAGLLIAEAMFLKKKATISPR